MPVHFNGTAKAGVRSVTVEATVHRADGTIEPLGTVAHWHKNPLRRLLWRIGKEGRR